MSGFSVRRWRVTTSQSRLSLGLWSFVLFLAFFQSPSRATSAAADVALEKVRLLDATLGPSPFSPGNQDGRRDDLTLEARFAVRLTDALRSLETTPPEASEKQFFVEWEWTFLTADGSSALVTLKRSEAIVPPFETITLPDTDGSLVEFVLVRSAQTWDGLDASGSLVADGTYPFRVDARTLRVDTPGSPASEGVTAPMEVDSLTIRRDGQGIGLAWSVVTSDVFGRKSSVAQYNIYRSARPDFVPDVQSGSNRILTTNEPGIDDGEGGAEPSNLFYVVTAVDTSNNESGIQAKRRVIDSIGEVTGQAGIDDTPPVILASVIPTPNLNGWDRTDVTVGFTCFDSFSGIDSCPASLSISGDCVNQPITGTALDVAGNDATVVAPVKIDRVPPVVTPSLSPPPNPNGWNNTDVTVTFQAQDDCSGVASVTPAMMLTGEGANQQVTGRAMDLADNGASATALVSIDKTKPTFSRLAPAPCPATINNQRPTVMACFSDSLSGIDWKAIRLSVDNVDRTADTTISGDCVEWHPRDDLSPGQHRAQIGAADLASNAGSATWWFGISPVDPLSLTTVVGVVVNESGGPADGAQASVLLPTGCLLGALAGPTGSFSVPDVPISLGSIVVQAQIEQEGVVEVGRSASVKPVRGGATDVGTIRLHTFRASDLFPSPLFEVGTFPRSVTVGDFNGDGKQDLAVANEESDDVSVLLGNGNGTFASQVRVAAGSRPYSIAIGDFNGDGKQDLVVANANSNDVSVLLGNGDGTFAYQLRFGTGSDTLSVAVGDFNGDGKQDLVVANEGSGDISVLLGIGDGRFASQARFAAGSRPVSVAVGDFNGDRRQDLALANRGSDDISVLLGIGDGRFASQARFGVGSRPESVAIGDLNGDGKRDLVVANEGSSDVSVLLGNGDGTFASEARFGAGSLPESVAVGDFNGDGQQDVVVANGDSYDVSVLLGNGDGRLASQARFAAGSLPFSVAVGDFNRDGQQDLVVANEGSDDVSVLLGNGDGTFTSQAQFGAGSLPDSVAVGDFNGDGQQDLVAANAGSSDVSVLLGDGDGTFASQARFAVGLLPSSVAVGDFNGDEQQDLVVANSGSYDGVSVLLGNGDGTFASEVRFDAGLPFSVAVGDFNRDGKQDLVAANFYEAGVSVLLGNGDGTFASPVRFAAGPHPTSVAIGDFNGDGKQDLVVAQLLSSDIPVLLGNGDGTFASPVRFDAGSIYATSVAVGDFNGDGKQDLVVANAQSLGVSVLLGNGDGTFAFPVRFAVGSGPISVSVGDFDGDGKQDLVVVNVSSADLSVLLGNGDGTFASQVRVAAGSRPYSIAIGDFNGDGREDLAVTNVLSDGVSVLLNQGPFPR